MWSWASAFYFRQRKRKKKNKIMKNWLFCFYMATPPSAYLYPPRNFPLKALAHWLSEKQSTLPYTHTNSTWSSEKQRKLFYKTGSSEKTLPSAYTHLETSLKKHLPVREAKQTSLHTHTHSTGSSEKQSKFSYTHNWIFREAQLPFLFVFPSHALQTQLKVFMWVHYLSIKTVFLVGYPFIQ